MLEPNFLVLIAPNASAGETDPAWVDVSADLQFVQIDRGSPSDLDRNNPGTATVILDNWSGDYDNENAGSPYAGGMVPMTPILIYAEHDGELYPRFRGFFDNVELDYPGEGTATATIAATDGFKVLAQTELPSSAYALEVMADSPDHWYRLDEPTDATVLQDSVGGRDLTLNGAPTLGVAGLISRDPGCGMSTTLSSDGAGVYGPAPARTAFTVEAVFRSADTDDGFLVVDTSNFGGLSSYGYTLGADLDPDQFRLVVATTAGTVFLASGVTADDDVTHHVAVTWDGATVTLYVDGVATDSDSLAGTIPEQTGNGFYIGGFTFNVTPNPGLIGTYDEVATYPAALSAERIAAHAEAVSTPWDGDTPGQRIHRLLDYAGWPTAMRDIDTGDATLQSADFQ